MSERLKFELVTPERVLRSVDVDMVVIPGSDGDFGILPGHAPIISTIRPGIIEVYDTNSDPERILILGGVCEVSADCCTVLADESIEVAKVDRPDLERRLKDAELNLESAINDDEMHHAADAISLLKNMIQEIR